MKHLTENEMKLFNDKCSFLVNDIINFCLSLQGLNEEGSSKLIDVNRFIVECSSLTSHIVLNLSQFISVSAKEAGIDFVNEHTFNKAIYDYVEFFNVKPDHEIND